MVNNEKIAVCIGGCLDGRVGRVNRESDLPNRSVRALDLEPVYRNVRIASDIKHIVEMGGNGMNGCCCHVVRYGGTRYAWTLQAPTETSLRRVCSAWTLSHLSFTLF